VFEVVLRRPGPTSEGRWTVLVERLPEGASGTSDFEVHRVLVEKAAFVGPRELTDLEVRELFEVEELPREEVRHLLEVVNSPWANSSGARGSDEL